MTDEGLLGGFDVDGAGAARPIGWAVLESGAPPAGANWRWVHLHRDGARAQTWLFDHPEPPADAVWALLAEDTRPRSVRFGQGDLVILRGVNLHPDAEPEDMVSLRLYVTRSLVVSVVRRPNRALDDLLAAAQAGRLPASTGGFVTALIEALRDQVEPVLDELEEIIEAHELDLVTARRAPSEALRAEFTDARQDTLMIRRHLAPQAAALRGLVQRAPDWLDAPDTVAEEAEAFSRIVADLDSIRERASVVRDEIAARTAERANDIVLLLSVVSAVFLPITFATGLLGMNVGGVPLAETRWGFWIVCAMLAAVAAAAGLIVRRLLKLM